MVHSHQVHQGRGRGHRSRSPPSTAAPSTAAAADDRVDQGSLWRMRPTAVRSAKIMARAWPPTCCGVASVAPASALMYSRTVHHQQRSSCS